MDEAEQVKHRSRVLRWVACLSFVWVFCCGLMWMGSGEHGAPDGFYREVFWGFVAALPGFLGAIYVFWIVASRLLTNKPSSVSALLVSIATLGGGLLMDLVVWQLVIDRLYPSQFAHGRRLHRGGKVLAPRSVEATTWMPLASQLGEIALPLEMSKDERELVAAQWRENGTKEHASIAAFAQLTLDLLTVGAPGSLVMAAQRAAADEVRHTELCYAIAKHIDGRDGSPAPFPEAHTRRELSSSRQIALARIAVDALADGALNEGIASRLLARLGSTCSDPQFGRLLREMATDEARHARDSWDLVEWCLAEGGAIVHAALMKANETMPVHLGSPLPPLAREGAWIGWGVQSEAMEIAEYRVVRRQAHQRLSAVLKAHRDVMAA